LCRRNARRSFAPPASDLVTSRPLVALDSYDRVRKGGASGEAVQPGDRNNYGKALAGLLSRKADTENKEKIEGALKKVEAKRSDPKDDKLPTFGDHPSCNRQCGEIGRSPWRNMEAESLWPAWGLGMIRSPAFTDPTPVCRRE